ncbi:MAG: hypothetical protein ABFS86_05335 [Planctomycetota bacterium]
MTGWRKWVLDRPIVTAGEMIQWEIRRPPTVNIRRITLGVLPPPATEPTDQLLSRTHRKPT